MGSLFHVNRFTRGEVEPALYDRIDVDFYAAAVKHMRNWLPLPAGAAKRRPPMTRGPDLPRAAGDVLLDSYLYGFSYLRTDYTLLVMLVRTTATGVLSLHFAVYDEDMVLEDDLGKTIIVTSEFSLSSELCFVSLGPAIFITSQKFPPHRVFYNATLNAFDEQKVYFYEELLGTALATNGSPVVTGVDSLYTEQVTVGDDLNLDGQIYIVQSIASNTSLTLTTNYTGLTKNLRIGREEEFPFGLNEYPALCTFYQGRLLLLSTPTHPVRMWASKPQDLFTILPGSVHDDSPIEYDLMVAGGDRFVWVYTTDRVFLGSRTIEGAIYSDQGSTFTPSTFSYSKVSSLGGAAAAPFATDASVVFLSSGGNQLYSVQYDLARQGFSTQNLSTLAPHLLEGGVKSFVYRPPVDTDFTPRVFCLRNDGKISVCTILEGEDVLGWSRFELETGYTASAVSASSRKVTTVVKHAVSGKSFLSQPNFDESEYALDFAQVCTVTAGIAAVTDVILFGVDVAVIDPSLGYLGFFTVNDLGGGSLGIDLTGIVGLSATVTIGLAFTDSLVLLPVVVENNKGVILNQTRRVTKVSVSVNNTRQVMVDGQPVVPTTQIGAELPLISGVFSIWRLGWTTQDELSLEGATIYPARILSVTREVSA